MTVLPQMEWTEEEDTVKFVDANSSSKKSSFARCEALVGVLNCNH